MNVFIPIKSFLNSFNKYQCYYTSQTFPFNVQRIYFKYWKRNVV